MPKFSGAELAMTGMKGAQQTPMKIGTVASVAPDGRTLVITPASALGVGSYRVNWHVISVDTHRVTGDYAFSVK